MPQPSPLGMWVGATSLPSVNFARPAYLSAGHWVMGFTVVDGNRTVVSSSFGAEVDTFYDATGNFTLSWWVSKIDQSQAGLSTFTVTYDGGASFTIGELVIIADVLPGYVPVVQFGTYGASDTSWAGASIATDKRNSRVFAMPSDAGEGATYSVPAGISTFSAPTGGGYGVFFKTYDDLTVDNPGGSCSPTARTAVLSVSFAPSLEPTVIESSVGVRPAPFQPGLAR